MSSAEDDPTPSTGDAWTKDVEWLWTQDDAIHHEDTVSRAWRRLFGGEIPRGGWVRTVDGGDAWIMVDAIGRVYCSSYPGENQLGVLRGSIAAARLPRLVISGAQTGADRGALDAARELGVATGGWAPKGWRAEDGQIPSSYRTNMQMSSSSEYSERTTRNVDDSDGTLILSLGAELTGGSRTTLMRSELCRKPRIHICLSMSGADIADEASRVVDWIGKHRIGVLNVAGPRESKEPGIQAAAHAFVDRVLRRTHAAPRVPIGTSEIPSLANSWQRIVEGPKEKSPIEVSRSVSSDRLVVTETADSVRLPSTGSGSFRWSPGQEAAIAAVRDWMSNPSAPQVFRLFGFAGTGKTTMVRELVSASRRSWLYAAYTGKAALVMRQKGCTGAQTIHSLIYRPDGDVTEDDDGRMVPRFKLWNESPLLDPANPGLVIDECSMVDDEVGHDLLSFGKKILVCGDPAQLPPVSGGGFFTDGTPDAMLTEVHRQARESGILDLATHVREGGSLAERLGWRCAASSNGGEADCEVISRPFGNVVQTDKAALWARMAAADQVICGTNRTRHQLNDQLRRIMGQVAPVPIVGDRVICLRNERRKGLLNGSQWRVRKAIASTDRRIVNMVLDSDDGSVSGVEVKSWAHHFRGEERQLDDMNHVRMAYQEFDFAYAITEHKAQGSQWGDVVLHDESGVFDAETRRRWIYTGITRAVRRLLVVL